MWEKRNTPNIPSILRNTPIKQSLTGGPLVSETKHTQIKLQDKIYLAHIVFPPAEEDQSLKDRFAKSLN